MNLSMMRVLPVAMLLGISTVAMPSFAQQTWSTLLSGCGGTATLMSCASTGDANIGNASATAWGAATSTNQNTSLASNNNNGYNSTGVAFTSSTLGGPWDGGGLGVYSGADASSPTHAVDNRYYTDAILLHFSTAVTLSQITIGWASNSSGGTSGADSDFSLFAFTGNTAPTGSTEAALANSAMSGTRIYDGIAGGAAKAISSSWTLVGNYADGDNPNGTSGTDTPFNVNAGETASSWWLISAYNSRYGGGCTGADGNASANCSNANDFFKVLSVAGVKPSSGNGGGVPEPASLALVAVALAGTMGMRRRSTAQP